MSEANPPKSALPLKTPDLTLPFPFTPSQVQAVIVAADAFGVEPWEMAQHVLNVRSFVLGETTTMPGRPR